MRTKGELVIQADSLDLPLKPNSVDMIMTSPPYWSLRDYETAGQIGNEPQLDIYHAKLLHVTLALHKILKPTGVMFWNHGDSYGGSNQSWTHTEERKRKGQNTGRPPSYNFMSKCMVMQNYRLILAMIDEQGWVLRNQIIWHKLNHMPSSVKDRFTSTYEPVFMLVKSQDYFFDLDAVRQPHKQESIDRAKRAISAHHKNIEVPGQRSQQTINRPRKNIKHDYAVRRLGSRVSYDDPLHERPLHHLGRNPGDHLAFPTQPFPEAHYAAFPEKLCEMPIEATCPEFVCNECGKPRERISEPSKDYAKRTGKSWHDHRKDKARGQRMDSDRPACAEFQTVGWTDCGCGEGFSPGIVLDPFCGSGTVGRVAKMLGRKFIGIDISLKYCGMSKRGIDRVGYQMKLPLP